MKISALGPKGSFSELAAQKFIEKIDDSIEIEMYPSMSGAIDAIGVETELAIVPVENMVEGYVSVAVDRLAHSDLKIIAELYLPIDFSFVANADSIDLVKRVYIQFVTQGQCMEFISKLPKDVEIITTESNSSSYCKAVEKVDGEGAIVPIHLGKNSDFKFVANGIGDNPSNMTRFFVLANEGTKCRGMGINTKTSILVTETADRPGSLYDILGEFKSRGLNLTSILSRPNKKEFGKYHFYLDVEADYPRSEKLSQAIDALEKFNNVKILGSYSNVG